jgi:hypothetical protein
MKIRGKESDDHNAASGQKALPFSRSRSKRIALFGIAGSLLVVGFVAASAGGQPDAGTQKASGMLSNAPLPVPKEEDNADASHVESATKTNTSAGTASSSSHETDVQVNGQDIDVPENGQVHRVITENNSQTTVDITSSSGNSSFSTDINVRSFSSEE